MRNFSAAACLLLLLTINFTGACFAQSTIAEGDPAPDHVFPAPAGHMDRIYLGLAKDAKSFRLNQVKADVLVLEFFNRRCRHCQKEAPNVNRLFELVRSKKLDRRIKFLGIGAYNSRQDVELFQRRHQVPFPLVPDPRLEAFNAWGAQGTPQFFVVRLDKKPLIVMTVSGFLPEPPDALEEIMRKTGLKAE